MKYPKLLLSFILITLFTQANTDRSIYKKNYGKENKVALVIGNSNYIHFSTLKNTLHDAKDMRDVLKAKDFDVLYLENGNLKSMKKIVRQFSHKLRQGGVGLFYYAGHGLEVDGKNYLVPTKAEIPDRLEVEYEALAVNMILDRMEDSHNRLNIVILDACRNDPFNKGRDIGGGGLAQINNAKGMYIAFATGPGEIASDGDSGRNGLFTKHLIKNISFPNLTLNEVFKKTRASVYSESHRKQMPWTSSSVIGDFYFQLDGEINGSSVPQTTLASTSNISDADKFELERLRRKERDEKEHLYQENKEIHILKAYHPLNEPNGLYIVSIKVVGTIYKYRIYCPTQMVRDISNNSFKTARHTSEEDTIKFSGESTLDKVVNEICK